MSSHVNGRHGSLCNSHILLDAAAARRDAGQLPYFGALTPQETAALLARIQTERATASGKKGKCGPRKPRATA